MNSDAARWRAEIDFLAGTETQKDALAAALAGVPAGHGVRAIVLREARRLLETLDHVPDRMWELCAEIEAVPSFSWAPYNTAAAFFLGIVTVTNPSDDLWDAVNLSFNNLDGLIRTSLKPIIEVVRTAAGRDVMAFINMVTETRGAFINFGDQYIERIASGHVRAHGVGIHPGISKYLFVPYYRTVMRLFEHDTAVVRLQYEDHTTFEIDIIW